MAEIIYQASYITIEDVDMVKFCDSFSQAPARRGQLPRTLQNLKGILSKFFQARRSHRERHKKGMRHPKGTGESFDGLPRKDTV